MKILIKKSITSIFLVLLSISFYGQSNVKYTVDIVNSVIHWKGFKPAGSRSGTIKFKSGIVNIENLKITEGNFVADMSTIKDDDGSSKLESHLKSEDFFEVETFPTAIFTIKSIENKNDKTYLVGDLTIKKITKQIVVPANISISQNTVKITTETFKVNRANYNIKYKSKSFFANLKNKFIHNDFDLKVIVSANKIILN